MKDFVVGGTTAVLLLAARAAHPVDCPPGQQGYETGRVVTAVNTVVVPGTASGMFSGVVMRKGLEYQISASGSIRVGVFGETGTPPQGWEPQGPAGPGFPSPDAFTFSLIYRKGRAGPWVFAGPGPINTRLAASDPDRDELWFAINDMRTSDNSGAFVATVREIAINYGCGVPPAPVTRTGPIGGAFVQGNRVNRGDGQRLPCEGKTPDGRRQSFGSFAEYCPGLNTTRQIPVEACTYAEARAEAEGLVAFGCHLAEAK